jgi:hypothetical protein
MISILQTASIRRIAILPLLLLATQLTSCKSSAPGDYARVTLGADYPRAQQLRVLLLPVRVDGRFDITEDLAVTDQFGQRLMEMGYRVIDFGQAKLRAKELGLIVTNTSSDADMMRVARELGVDAVAKGRVTVAYQPGRSESGTKVEKLTRTEIRNGTHRKDTVIIREEVPTNYSYSSEGTYYPASQSLTLVAVPSGELWLSASVERSSDYDMTEELAAGIRRAVR